DLATGTELATLTGHMSIDIVIAFAGPGRLVSSGSDGTVRLWNADTWQSLWVVQDKDIFSLAASPDGKTLATGHHSGLVKLWDTDPGHELRVLQGHTKNAKGEAAIRWVTFTPDGKTLASAGEDKTIRLWQVATGLELLCLKDQPHFVNGLAFSPDGTSLA